MYIYTLTARKPAQRFCMFFLRTIAGWGGGGGWGGGINVLGLRPLRPAFWSSSLLCSLVSCYVVLYFVGGGGGGGVGLLTSLVFVRHDLRSDRLLYFVFTKHVMLDTSSLLLAHTFMLRWIRLLYFFTHRTYFQVTLDTSSLLRFHTSCCVGYTSSLLCYVGYVFSTSLHILSCYVGYVFSTLFSHIMLRWIRLLYFVAHTFMLRWIRLLYFFAHTFMLRWIRLLYFFAHTFMLCWIRLLYFVLHILSC